MSFASCCLLSNVIGPVEIIIRRIIQLVGYIGSQEIFLEGGGSEKVES